MGKPAARRGDAHVCPMVDGTKPHVGGPITAPCAPTVLIGGQPAARITDLAVCMGPTDMIVTGSATVLISGMPAARIGDRTMHGGVVVHGWPTVLIGDSGSSGGRAGGPAPPPPWLASIVDASRSALDSAAQALADMYARTFPSSDAEALARLLVQPGGSADASDVELVVAELKKVPVKALQIMARGNVKVVVARGSVTDYATNLKGVQPRGWPPGATWDIVPGAYMPNSNEVVVATTGHGTPAGAHVPTTGEGHGSKNMIIHEAMHSVDAHAPGAANSSGKAFNDARNKDLANLSSYEQQTGNAGQEETYAESAARYYGGSSTGRTPAIDGFWDSAPLGSPPAPSTGK